MFFVLVMILLFLDIGEDVLEVVLVLDVDGMVLLFWVHYVIIFLDDGCVLIIGGLGGDGVFVVSADVFLDDV